MKRSNAHWYAFPAPSPPTSALFFPSPSIVQWMDCPPSRSMIVVFHALEEWPGSRQGPCLHIGVLLEARTVLASCVFLYEYSMIACVWRRYLGYKLKTVKTLAKVLR